MSNNFYQPKNEFGKVLVPASTPKLVAGAKSDEYIDLSWLKTQDSLTFETDLAERLVTGKALKDLQEQIKGQIQFKFIKVTQENPLPTKITEANVDDLRTSIYIEAITGTNKVDGIDEYAEYVCTNTADFISDEETSNVTPKFERFGIGVAKATASVQGAVTLSDTADSSKDASQSIAATPKAVADAVSAAKTELEGKIKSAADKAAEDLADVQSQLDELEKTVEGHTTDIAGIKSGVAELEKTVEGLEGDVAELQSDVSTAKTDITELKSDVTDLEEKVAGMEEAAEGVAVVGTLSLTVPATGSVKADFPLETSLVRFEIIENGAVTTLYPGVSYATAGEKKQEITLTFWAADSHAQATVKAHYVTTKAKAALFAEPDSDPEEEEEEQGSTGDDQQD